MSEMSALHVFDYLPFLAPLSAALEPATAALKSRAPAGVLDNFESYDLLSVLFALSYLAVIFGGQALMRHRKGFTGKEPGFKLVFLLWNIAHASYSIWALYVSVTCSIFGVKTKGTTKMFQIGSWGMTGACASWGYIYTISKGVEFGDTVFLVLKKSKLRTLHWLHHFLTYIVVYKWCRETGGNDGLCVMLGISNVGVHSVMYSYYAAKTLGWSPPESVPQFITTIQLIQMVYLNLGVNYGYFIVPIISFSVWVVYFPMVFLYLILFSRMYINRYIRGTDMKSKKAKRQ